MKKIKSLFLGTLALLLASCAESKYEWHDTHFEPQLPGGMMFYADQEYDSIKVFSFDPWTAMTEGDSAWFTISPTSGDARPGSSALTRIDIKMPQNTTGRNRKNAILVKSHFNVRMPIAQNSWLNISRPTPKTFNGENFLQKTVYFELNLGAKTTSDNIQFHVYQDNATLSLENGEDWISFTGANEGKNVLTFNKGTHNVPIKTKENTFTNKRNGMLVLKSGEVVSSISINQEAKKEDK